MDKEQFIDIIQTHRNLIYKICNGYCAEPEDRKDLEQEILLQLWISIKRYDGRVKLSTWIYKVALNTAISFFRVGNKQKNKKTELEPALITLEVQEEDAPQDDNISMLYQFINQLNDFDKALILLYLDDTKQKEIAEILGITPTNVATKIARIKQKLKTNFMNQQKMQTYGIG